MSEATAPSATICETCGALVANARLHQRWHNRVIAKDVAKAQQRIERRATTPSS